MDSGCPDSLGESDVLRTISNDPRAGEVEIECGRGSLGHAGHRLPVDTCAGEFRDRPLGMVRAVEELVDVSPVLGKEVGEVAMHGLDIADPEEPLATPAWLLTTATGTPA